MTTKTTCPYCGEAVSEPSADHVIPQFLGGKKKILACRSCNNGFGHTIEAAASEALKQIMLVLRTCGVPMHRDIRWRNVPYGPNKELYNVDQDMNLEQVKPELRRDEDGRIVSGVGSLLQMQQLQRSLEGDGLKTMLAPVESPLVHLSLEKVRVEFDDDLKRLAIKMATALCAVFDQADPLDLRAKTYLLTGEALGGFRPVRAAYDDYSELDQIRPKAGHLVFVRGSPGDRCMYAVVQLFTAIQFFCELHNDYAGPDVCFVATYDPIIQTEQFKRIPIMNFLRPPWWSTVGTFVSNAAPRWRKFEREVVQLVGKMASRSQP